MAPPPVAPVVPTTTAQTRGIVDDSWGDDDDDGGWGDDDDVDLDNDLAMRNIAAPPRSAPSGLGRSKLRVPGGATSSSSATLAVVKPAVQKLSLDDTVDDGWDDF